MTSVLFNCPIRAYQEAPAGPLRHCLNVNLEGGITWDKYEMARFQCDKLDETQLQSYLTPASQLSNEQKIALNRNSSRENHKIKATVTAGQRMSWASPAA